MKEKFTTEEWGLLKLLPFHVFLLVAGADKNVDKEEIAQFDAEIKGAPFYKDPLHREIALDILTSDVGDLLRQAMDVSRFAERMTRMKTVLQTKLTHDEYQRFVGSLFINGLKIARASGGGPLGMGDKVSQEEKVALAALATMFELDVNTIAKNFG